MSGIKFITAVLSLLFIFSPAWAEEDVFRHPLGPLTLDVFNKTSTRLAENPIVRGNFEQERVLSRFNRSLESSGNFIIAADLGMLWETLQPFPSALALGKDYLIQSRPGGQRAVLSAQGNETFLRLAEVISAVFSGRTQGLMDNFEVYYSGSTLDWEMGLIPRDRTIASFAVRITMKGGAEIRSILINEQNGDTITYTLSNHSYPPELTVHEKFFFTPP